MISRFIFLALIALQLCLPAFASKASLDTADIGQVPILHQGRIKPLDTFARVFLLTLYQKSSLPEMTASEWILEVLFNPKKANELKVFKVRNLDVIQNLSLVKNEKNLFSFNEISKGLSHKLNEINKLTQVDKENRTIVQQQLVELYQSSLAYYELAGTFSFAFSDFEIKSKKLAKELGVEVNKKLTYRDFLKKFLLVRSKVDALEKKDKFTEDEKELITLAARLQARSWDANSGLFRVIPPQWGKEDAWFSPWLMFDGGRGSPVSSKYVKTWLDLRLAFLTNNQDLWSQSSSNLLKIAHENFSPHADPKLIKLEESYNRWDLFTKSISFYILSFLLLALSWMFAPALLKKLSFISLGIGFVIHVFGLVVRCIVMARPPVSTLYESIIFVGAIVVLGSILLEKVRKDGLGIFVATLLGSILHFIGFSYAIEGGDSMGMLVAVLNSNFWLATHVVTITIGYGCCFVAGTLAHVYLFRRTFKPNDKTSLLNLNKNMMGSVIFALLFCLIGTILGGIWADQSWGRFWGWDPKENGAMLICLWLLMVMHGKISGILKPLFYAALLAFINVVVVLAWFGVNLLNVGLHSYGFTDSVAFKLVLFCAIEFMVISLPVLWISLRDHAFKRAQIELLKNTVTEL